MRGSCLIFPLLAQASVEERASCPNFHFWTKHLKQEQNQHHHLHQYWRQPHVEQISREKAKKKTRSERPLKEIAQQSEFCFLRFGVCICFIICICIRLINSSRGEWIEVKGVIKYQYRIFVYIFVDKSIVELRLREVYLCVFFLFLLALYLYLYLYAWLCLFSNLYSYQLFYLYLYPCVFVLTKDLLWVCREGLARWGAAASMYSLTLSFLPCTVFTPPPMSSSSSA